MIIQAGETRLDKIRLTGCPRKYPVKSTSQAAATQKSDLQSAM